MDLEGTQITRVQEFALIWEMDSAKHLLTHGVGLFTSRDNFVVTLDPMFTVLSIGVEKMLKLTHGIGELSRGAEWPKYGSRGGGIGHGLIELDDMVREQLRSWVDENPTAYRAELLSRVDEDPGWPLIRAALHDYANAGRFHNLDQLRLTPPEREAPSDMWVKVENTLIENEPYLREGRARAVGGSGAEFEKFLVDLRARVGTSVWDWWRLIARLNMHGVNGQRGKGFGSQIDPDVARPI